MLLMWDGQTNMPPGASGARSQQQAALSGILHELETSRDLGDLLEAVSLEDELSEWEAATVRNARREYAIACKIPAEVAQREATLKQEGVAAWAKARAQSDWKIFAPVLEEWVCLLKRKAVAVEPEEPLYDTLVSQYERGFSSDRLHSLFTAIKERLVPLIQAVREAQGKHDSPSREKMKDIVFVAQKQEDLARLLVQKVGFDFQKGRFDRSLHPFSAGVHPTDVRMTSRYNESDVFEGIRAAIHEAGHSLYEQNLPVTTPDGQTLLPAAKAQGMGVHESQSLLMERMVGINLPFWKGQFSVVEEAFPELSNVGIDCDEFYRCMNTVTPGAIRVSADELTYPIHVILRWEIESALMNGTLSVADVPQVWNEKMKDYLGVTITDDAEGALQDIHWGFGMLGFFPTYVLGAVYAAQYYKAAEEQIEGLEELLSSGDLEPLLQWLKTNIHQKGSFFENGDALCENVTGRPLDESFYLDYLTKKYTDLYHLQ